MVKHNEPGIFDVSKPSKTMPSATSKPVITGHHPIMADPMVKDDHADDLMNHDDAPKVTSVPVKTDDDEPAEHHEVEIKPPEHSESEPEPEPKPEPAGSIIEPEVKPSAPGFTPVASTIAPGNDFLTEPPPLPTDDNVIDSLSLPTPRGAGLKRSRRALWVVLVLLVLLAGYGVADAFTSVSLPFYIFRKTASMPQPVITPPPTPPATPPVQTGPTGFTKSTIAGTPISFSYPNAWGAPSATAEQGFTARGGTNKATNNYAYIINFATNKDVQIAITSAKYLPPTRGALYYDFLQWCTGTNDQKIYKSVLRFSTSNGVDSPATITCDQGPLTDATKLDDTTIVQLKTKDSDGKTVLGDLYTKNLKDSNLVVMRVKDAAMTNADNVKKLLSTVTVSATATPSQ